jgi:hypothetical protein
MIFLPAYEVLLHHLIIIELRYAGTHRRLRFDQGKFTTASMTESAGKVFLKKSEPRPARRPCVTKTPAWVTHHALQQRLLISGRGRNAYFVRVYEIDVVNLAHHFH